MNKKLIRLTESDLHRIVKESVSKVLRENTRATEEAMMDKTFVSFLKAIVNLRETYSKNGKDEYAKLTEKLYQDVNKAINDFYGTIDAWKEDLAYNYD